VSFEVDKERWAYAQSYEREYWELLPEETVKEQKEIEKTYWKYHLAILAKFFEINDEKKIMEIGTGIYPLLSNVKDCKKYFLDPLMDIYKSNFKFTKNNICIKGIGEALPFPDGYFDAVVTTNTIDHVQSPIQTLSEIKRVLKKNGTLYLTVNCWIPLLRYYRQLKEYFGFGDKGHPHSFSVSSFKKLIESSGLKVIAIENGIKEIGGYVEKSRLSKNPKKEGAFKKLFRLYKNHGVYIILDRIILKVLSYTGSIFAIEKREITDFIFVITK
jgi:ubiquinone/menaquinone biosynthesis C-methylase UbiE